MGKENLPPDLPLREVQTQSWTSAGPDILAAHSSMIHLSSESLYSAHPPPVLSLVHHPHRWTPAPSHSLLLQQNGRGVFLLLWALRWHLAWSIRDVYTPEDHVFCQCQCNIQGHLPAEAEKVCRVSFWCDFIASSPGASKTMSSSTSLGLLPQKSQRKI